MAEIVGLAASAAGGGVFGLVGTALGRVAGFFERRQSMNHETARLKHETARWAHEVELIGLQQAAAREETEAELALANVAGSWDGLRASMTADAAIASSYRWVDAIRGLTRPILTLLLWLIATGIWLGADPASKTSIVETATFAATAATLWWFGDRAPRRG